MRRTALKPLYFAFAAVMIAASCLLGISGCEVRGGGRPYYGPYEEPFYYREPHHYFRHQERREYEQRRHEQREHREGEERHERERFYEHDHDRD